MTRAGSDFDSGLILASAERLAPRGTCHGDERIDAARRRDL